MKGKIKLLCALLVSVLIGAGALACKGNSYTFPEYSYENETDAAVETDAEITLDGNIDESFWADKVWFSSSLADRPDITVRFTSHFSEKGAYFAFDVNDPEVYAVPERNTFYNSGVELYVSDAAGAENIKNGNAYELDLDASGRTRYAKFIRQNTNTYGYTAWVGSIYGAAVTKNGAVNTEECTGYTSEMFLPWSMFGGKQDMLYVNLALIRMASANPEDEDRLWYNFGMEERSATWTGAKTWYIFNEGGLEANVVNLESSGNGAINGSDYVLAGDDYTFDIVPDSGSYLKSLKINGVESVDGIKYDYVNMSAGYTVKNVTGDLDIKAEFAQLSGTRTVSGTVAADVPLPNNNFALASVYAVKNGSITRVPVASDGSFEAQAPADSFTFVAMASNYFTSKAEVTEGATEAHIALYYNNFGNNEDVSFTTYDDSAWDFGDYVSDGTIRSTSTVMHNTVLRSDVYGETVLASAIIPLPKVNKDVRAGITFYSSNGENVFFAITWNFENSRLAYCVQTIRRVNNSDQWSTEYSLSKEADVNLLNAEGLPFAVRFSEKTFTIYINGVAVGTNVTVKGADGNTNMFDNGFAAAGFTTWANGTEFKNAVVTAEDTEYPSAEITPIKTVSGNGSVNTDKATYAAGDDVTVTFVPGEGTQLSAAYVNGTDVFADVSNNTLVLENLSAGFLMIRAEFMDSAAGTASVSGTVSGYKFGENVSVDDIASVKLKNAASFNELLTLTDGAFSVADVPFGSYYLTVEADGYVAYSEKILLQGDWTDDITLQWNFGYVVNGSVDDSLANTAERAVTMNGSAEYRLTLDEATASGTVAAVGANIKVNSVRGNWNDNFGFVMAEKDGTRYGISLLFVDLNNATGTAIAKAQWGGGDLASLPPWVRTSLLSEDGLNVMSVRRGATIDFLGENGGIWYILGTFAIPEDAVTSVTLGQWGNSTYSNIFYTSDLTVALEVVAGEHGTASAGEISYGEDLVVAIAPESGYVIDSVTVNGVSFENISGASLSDNVLTVADWYGLDATVNVTFKVEEKTDVTFGIDLIKGTDNSDIPDDTEVILTGINEYSAFASNGSVTFSGVLYGEYTLSVAGYEQLKVTVPYTGDTSIELEYDWVDNITNIDNVAKSEVNGTVDMNSADPSVSWSDSVSEMVWFNFDVSSNFSYEAIAYWPGYDTTLDNRLTAFAIQHGSDKNNVIAVDFNAEHNQLQAYHRWDIWDSESKLTVDEVAALKAGTLKIRIVRVDNMLYLYVGVGIDTTSWRLGFSQNLNDLGSVTTGLIGVGQLNAGAAKISGITYLTEAGSNHIAVTKLPAENGSFEVSDVAVGGNLVVTATAHSGYYVEKITVNGTDYNSFTDGENGAKVLTLSSFSSAFAAEVSVSFAQVQTADVSFTLKGYRDGAGTVFADGTEYTLTGPTTVSGEITGGRLTQSGLLAGDYTVTVDGYSPASFTLTADGYTDEITLDFIFAEMINGDADLSGMNDAVHAISLSKKDSTGSRVRIVLDDATAAGKTAYLYAKIKADAVSGNWDDNFGVIMASEGNSFYGMTFLYQSLDNTSSNTYIKQNWAYIDNQTPVSNLPVWIADALKGDGLEVMYVRNGATVDLFAKNGTVWTYMCGITIPETAKTDIILGQWGKSTYSDIRWSGDISIDVAVNSSVNGQVTAGNTAYNSTLELTVTPEEGYMLDTLYVNGVSYTEISGASFDGTTVTVPNWKFIDTVVSATFKEAETAAASFTLKGYKDGAETVFNDGTAYTLSGAMAASGVITGGKVVQTELKPGDYTVTVDGYIPASFTLTSAGYTDEITLDFIFAEMINGDADLSGMNDAVHAISLSKKDSTGSRVRIVLDDATAAGKTAYLYAKIKADAVSGNWDDNFGVIMASEGNSFYGMTFLYQSLDNTSSNTYIKQNWAYIDNQTPVSNLPVWIADALKGDGLEVMYVRNGATVDLFAKNGTVWTYMCGITIPETAKTDIILGQWGKSTYSDIRWSGDISIDVAVNSSVNGQVTAGNTAYNSTLELTVTPEEGYMLDTLYVNGVSYTELLASGGSYTDNVLTVPGWKFIDTVVSATFKESATTDIEFAVNLHKYGVGENNLAAIPDGTPVTLTGVNQYVVEASGGKISQTDVAIGEYTVSIDGYLPVTVTVGDELQSSYTFEYDSVDGITQSGIYNVSDVNNGTLKTSAPGIIYLNETVAAGEDFMITGLFSAPDFTGLFSAPDFAVDEIRYGFVAFHDSNGDGTLATNGAGTTSTAELVMQNIIYQNGKYTYQFCDTWKGSDITGSALELYNGDGLIAGLARVSGRYYIVAYDGSSYSRVVTNSVYTSGLEDGELQLAYRTWAIKIKKKDANDTSIQDVSSLVCEQYEILRGSEVSQALFGTTAVRDVIDTNSNVKAALDAQVVWTDGEKSVTYTAASKEIVLFSLPASNEFTYTATVVVESWAGADKRLTPFAMRSVNGENLFAIDINKYNFQARHAWNWGDMGNGSIPEEAISDNGDGTKDINVAIKVTLKDGVLTLYAGASQDSLTQIFSRSTLNNVALTGDMYIGAGQDNVCAYSITDITYTTTVE